MPTDSGPVLILTLNPVKSIEKHAQAMGSILPQNANVIKTIMEQDANTGMNARQIKIAAFRENVLTSEDLHCHANSAIAIWDGLEQLATKVS